MFYVCKNYMCVSCLIYPVYLYRLILINYMYHPRQYICPLFRMILINYIRVLI